MKICTHCLKNAADTEQVCRHCKNTLTENTQPIVYRSGMSVSKKVLIGLGVVIILSAIGKVIGKHDGDTSASSATAAEAAAPALAVTAENLSNEYRNNEVSADAQYKGKTVAVSGVVLSIGNDIVDHPYVVLGTGNNEYELTGVQCSFDDKNAVAAMNKGDKITVTGKCLGKMMNVQLKNCHL